jgi:DNA-binding transcriptional LysR family regulator
LSAGDFAVLLNGAVHGLGVALLPQVDCRDCIAGKKLERVLPEWSVADGILHLVFTSRRGMLPGVRAVVDFMAETLKSQDTA